MLEENYAYIPQDEEEGNLLATAAGSAAVSGGLATGILAERARRKQASNKQQGINQSYGDAFKSVSKDAVADLDSALKVVTGNTSFDLDQEKRTDKPVSGEKSVSLRNWAAKQKKGSQFSTNIGSPAEYVPNPLTQAAISARDAFSPSSEDLLGFKREERLERGISPEGPKSDTVLNRIPLWDGVRDLLPEGLGGFNANERKHRQDIGIDLMRGNSAQAGGSFIGRAGNDFINNGARNLWWLLNAPQAVVDVSAEALMGKANREGLYGLDYALEDEARQRDWIDGGDNPSPNNSSINPVKYDFLKPGQNDPQIERRVQMLRQEGQTGNRLYSKRRVGNNLSTLMTLPASFLINEGLGLTNINGGDDGRKAVFASEEDPTKTDNVVAEIAAKYILGRQGDLLPWDEYKKVRPDVTKDEYMAYKAYKFNKAADWNILDDGDINILNGIIKTNDDGIDGGELMFLGRSMPYATTLVPTAAAILGSAFGAGLGKHGSLNIDGVQEDIGRRETQRQVLSDDFKSMTNEGADEEAIKRKVKQIEEVDKALDRKKKRLDWMETGPASGFFKNKAVRGRGTVAAGLITSALLGGTASVIGHEAERRRRIEEAEQGI